MPYTSRFGAADGGCSWQIWLSHRSGGQKSSNCVGMGIQCDLKHQTWWSQNCDIVLGDFVRTHHVWMRKTPQVSLGIFRRSIHGTGHFSSLPETSIVCFIPAIFGHIRNNHGSGWFSTENYNCLSSWLVYVPIFHPYLSYLRNLVVTFEPYERVK